MSPLAKRPLCILIALILLGASLPCSAAGSRAIRVRWSDAAELVRGKQVSIKTVNDRTHKGRVVAVDPDAISLRGRSGSPDQAIANTDVAEIRLIEYVGNGRRMGKFIGGGVGLLGGLAGAVAVGLDETNAGSGSNKALAAVLAVAGLPAGLLVGYLVGRQADKEVTVIRIIPE